MAMGLILVPFLFATVSAKTLKIGSMSPLTGPYASDGTDIKNGVWTAIKVFEEAGGMPGYDKIEFFPQDTACDPRQAVAAANKLLNHGVVGVVGAYCSSSTIPSSEVLDEESIPMITPASTHQDVTDRGLEYMFRMCGRDDDQAPAAAKFIKEALGAKTMFIVDDKTTYSQGLADCQPGRQRLFCYFNHGKTEKCRCFLYVSSGILSCCHDDTPGQTPGYEIPDRYPGCRIPA